ncbi:hypothetical protein E2C01_075339 [Portunus trituberculatus]|uniref:Uncharacterized protein n=1 Tax=Portunus trituberculatus TaxID=210409 RepID=A0A5B7I5U9_PORTR|nr:hypothetical protein [Portunus trituberculatus]
MGPDRRVTDQQFGTQHSSTPCPPG